MRVPRLALTAATLLLAMSCTKRREPPTAPHTPPPATPRTITVRMRAAPNVFVPRDTVVAPGDTVLWINDGGFHTTTSGPCPPCTPDGLWDSGLMSAGATFRVVFGPGTDAPGLVHVDSTGLLPYYCEPHAPDMAGSITVMP
jgi:plastocyanin